MHYFFCLKFPNTSCEEHRNWNRAYGGLICGNEKISFVAHLCVRLSYLIVVLVSLLLVRLYREWTEAQTHRKANFALEN